MADLGDTFSNTANLSFDSPEADENITDYSLRYSQNESNRTPIVNPYGGTSKRNTARKSTSRKQMSPKRAPASKKKPTVLQRDRRFWKEVRRLQDRTDNLIPRSPFQRLIREIIHSISQNVSCITREALFALQEASEMYLSQQFEDAYMLTVHRGRVTLMTRDMELLRVIRSHILPSSF